MPEYSISQLDRIEAAMEYEPHESPLCDWCPYWDLCPVKKQLFRKGTRTRGTCPVFERYVRFGSWRNATRPVKPPYKQTPLPPRHLFDLV